MPEPTEGELVSPILFVTNWLATYGGAERYVSSVANWMAARGAEVAVVAGLVDSDELLAPAVRFRSLPVGTRPRLGSVVVARELRRVVREVGPRAIVTNSLFTAGLARLALVGLRLPVITVAHGWPARRYRYASRLLRVADHVVAVSHDVHRQLVAHGLPESRCEVIVNGVDLEPFGPHDDRARESARRVLGASPDEVVVVAVGRLAEEKAQHHLVTAARLTDGVHFALVGDGPRRAELEELAAEAGVIDRVSFLGMRRDVPDLLAAADIYTICSDREGMPLSTIEAMASSLPVVATATEGMAQLLDASCGVVVPIGDAAGLAAGIGRLADDPQLRARMGAAARLRVEQGFSLDQMASTLARTVARVVHAH